jgi:hypothetical protein
VPAIPKTDPSRESNQMTKEQGHDSIEHLRQMIRESTHDMIATAGGVQKIGAHRITDTLIRRIFALAAGSSEGDRLGRAFVKAVVQALYAEGELRQRFKELPRKSSPMRAFGTH